MSSNHDEPAVMEQRVTSDWIWSDHEYTESDPIEEVNDAEAIIEDIRSARLYQERMLEHILDECQHDELPVLRGERKNSQITEPGSPLRKKKKIKKLIS